MDEKYLTTQEEAIPQPIFTEARSGSYAGDALSQWECCPTTRKVWSDRFRQPYFYGVIINPGDDPVSDAKDQASFIANPWQHAINVENTIVEFSNV